MAGAGDTSAPAGRSTRRGQGATPVRNESNRRTTRADSAAPDSTPGTRRSTRRSGRQSDLVQDIVTNDALPQVQTRQSYAYGASKAPLLPEQLHAQGKLSLSQVAAQMDSAIQNAERNFQGQLRDVLGSRPEQGDLIKNQSHQNQQVESFRAQPKTKGTGSELPIDETNDAQKKRSDPGEDDTSRRQLRDRTRTRETTPASQFTEKQRQKRTAAWASSLDSDQLEDISEESSNITGSPETRRSEPSSFPSGVFDHSYNYERGARAPRTEPVAISRIFAIVAEEASAVRSRWHSCWLTIKRALTGVIQGITDWFHRLGSTTSKSLYELPDSVIVSSLVKSFFLAAIAATISLSFCHVYNYHLCSPYSTSVVSQSLQTLCGTCRATNHHQPLNFTSNGTIDLNLLTNALRSVDSRINTLESRLGQRIDSRYAAVQSDLDTLRRQQTEISATIEALESTANNQRSDIEADTPSPFIPKINFFSPRLGAIVNPRLTSPTQAPKRNLILRSLDTVFRLRRQVINGPLTALQTWSDVGECWCAAASAPGQDSVRIGIDIPQFVYPTELIVEHAPANSTLTPETAPRDIELWADFAHIANPKQWTDLNLNSMQSTSDGITPPTFGSKTWVRLAQGTYDISPSAPHVQRFKLDVNDVTAASRISPTSGLRYTARRYVVRARTNHGASYSCLYRLRLHGVLVEEGDEGVFNDAVKATMRLNT